MLRSYQNRLARLTEIPATELQDATDLVWLDLLHPTAEEEAVVAGLMGIEIPTRAEMEEIELSARLYTEDGAEFMTMTALSGLDTEEPMKTAITFILKGTTLVTVRYADPRPFAAFTPPAAPAPTCFWACSRR
jgi:magnesium transporter